MKTKHVKDKKGRQIAISMLTRKDMKALASFSAYHEGLSKEELFLLSQKAPSKAQIRRYLAKQLRGQRQHTRFLLIARHGEEIAGMCSVWLRKGRASHVAKLRVSVAKEYRNAGIGKHLLATSIELAPVFLRPSPKQLRLSVFSGNRKAKMLYRKLGFKKVASIPAQFKYKGKYYGEEVMVRKLE
jgi:ribosomal protein S18 acetylase RimI-like enzyme